MRVLAFGENSQQRINTHFCIFIFFFQTLACPTVFVHHAAIARADAGSTSCGQIFDANVSMYRYAVESAEHDCLAPTYGGNRNT